VHEPIELLVVDPQPALRGALRAALELEDVHADRRGGRRPGCCCSGRPDGRIAVALVDSRLAELQSPFALEALRALARRVPVVVMGMGDPALYAASYVAAGASGYWAKDGDLTALVGLLRAARRSAPGRLAV